MNSIDRIVLSVDVREIKLLDILKQKLQGNQKIELQEKALSVGDIVIESKGSVSLVIERKSISDLASSICDGRYTEQSYRLNNIPIHNHNIIYIIEGDIRKFKENTRIKKKGIYSTLCSLNAYKGFSVLRTFDLEETAELLIQFSEKIFKNSTKEKLHYSLSL